MAFVTLVALIILIPILLMLLVGGAMFASTFRKGLKEAMHKKDFIKKHLLAIPMTIIVCTIVTTIVFLLGGKSTSIIFSFYGYWLVCVVLITIFEKASDATWLRKHQTSIYLISGLSLIFFPIVTSLINNLFF